MRSLLHMTPQRVSISYWIILLMMMTQMVACSSKHAVVIEKKNTPPATQVLAKKPDIPIIPAPVEQTTAPIIEPDIPVVVKTPSVRSVQTRKKEFFAWLRPIVLSENMRMSAMRQRVKYLQMKAAALNAQERNELRQIAKNHKVRMPKILAPSFWKVLLDRVDIIPLELTLSQAANESAWGTSRFATNGNNYFGQWCFSQGCGIVPKGRLPGKHHEVRIFDSADMSVRSYMNNLNTQRSYQLFRLLRTNLRQQHRPLDAMVLALGLKYYSERGMRYVHIIRNIIRKNRYLMSFAVKQ